jgi:hypothetical protein
MFALRAQRRLVSARHVRPGTEDCAGSYASYQRIPRPRACSVVDRRTACRYIVFRMETDSFFYQLLKQLPETLFALLGEPLTRVADYRFDALEVKKSYRLDGLFVPARADLPVYFVEVQFQRARRFYANLFAKVFSNGLKSL